MQTCFSSDKIDDYLLQRLTEEEARAWEEHYFNCPDCFRDMSEREELMAVIKSRGPEIFDEPRASAWTEPSRVEKFLNFFTPRRWVFVSLAVIALIVIVFGVMPRQRPAPPHFVLDGEEVLRGETLTLISPVIDVTEPPPVFEWKTLPDADEYKVSLYAETLIWSVTTKNNSVALPEEIKAQLAPEQKYSWQVKAFSLQGQLIAVSSRLHFQISPAVQ
jgi:hypothetical protein